jgi:hypothetical protein
MLELPRELLARAELPPLLEPPKALRLFELDDEETPRLPT